MNRRYKKWMHVVCPTRCACCGRVIHYDQSLCEECAESLPVIPSWVCGGCGEPLKKCCCYRQPRTQIPCISPWFYEGTVKRGLLTLKQGNSIHGASYFGEQMANLVLHRFGDHFDGVAYVPVFGKSQSQNHSRYLARAMAECLGIPVLERALIQKYPSPAQHRLGLRRRKGNVFGLYEADARQVAGKHILLVDDIVTTGTTLDECAKMLFLADCEEVCAVTAASTRLTKEGKETDDGYYTLIG